MLSLTRRRMLFGVLLVASLLVPFGLVMPESPFGGLRPDWTLYSAAATGVAFAACLVLVSYCGKAAVWAELPGGFITAVVVWWVAGVLLALVALGIDYFVFLASFWHAVSFGILTGLPNPGWSTLSTVLWIEGADGTSLAVPFWPLLYAGSYLVYRRARRRVLHASA